MMKKLGILFLSVVMILFMASAGMAQANWWEDAGWYHQKNHPDMVRYFDHYPEGTGQGWVAIPEDEMPLNGVESNVEGEANHYFSEDYGNDDVGGFATNDGFSEYEGTAAFDGNIEDAENHVRGAASTDGEFHYHPGEYYNPESPNCLGSGDPGIDHWDQASPLSEHLLNNIDANSNKMTNQLHSSASLQADNSGWDLTNGELRTVGDIQLQTWSTTDNWVGGEDGYGAWSSGSQKVHGEYVIENTTPSLNSEVWGNLDGKGGTSTLAGRDRTSDHRSAMAAARTGNELEVTGQGKTKEYGVHGSGYVSGGALSKYESGSFAYGHFQASYTYDLNDASGNYYGFKANGGAEGKTTTNMNRDDHSMSVEVHTESGAHSCPVAK